MPELIRIALGAAAVVFTTLAAAQGAASYPSKPLRVIVPFAPGVAWTR
jgi:tripartite-type tricarboxylate transporter receptor subunit TctC